MTKNNTKTTSILTITFFAALLLIPAGMNLDAFATPDVEDDLTVDNGWIHEDSNTSYDGTGDEIDLLSVNTVFIKAHVDLQDSVWLGENLDDNQFVIRAIVNKNTNPSDAANGDHVEVAVTNSLVNGDTASDSVGMQMRTNWSGGTNGFTAFSTDNETTNQGLTAKTAYDWQTGLTYWEIIGSTDTLTANVYSDSDFSILIGTSSVDHEDPTDLQFLVFRNNQDSNRAGSSFSLEDIKIWNGVSSVPTVPDAPTNLIATSGNSQVPLTWTTPTNDGGSSITDYKIEYGNGTSWAIFSDGNSTATSGIVTGLTNGQQYSFRTSAENSEGFGSVSDTAVATPNITIQELQNQILAMNATINQQQEDIDYLYEIWEDIRDTIITWLTGRP